MKRTLKLAFSVTAIGLLLGGCMQGHGPKQTGGLLVGGGLGALAGSQIGNGSGKLAVIAWQAEIVVVEGEHPRDQVFVEDDAAF